MIRFFYFGFYQFEEAARVLDHETGECSFEVGIGKNAICILEEWKIITWILEKED